MRMSPPLSEHELLERAADIAGKTLQYIANLQNISLPDRLTSAKGQVGEMLEYFLGASAGTLPEADFLEIGVELKTIPVNRHGRPKESTFICTVNLLPNQQPDWATSTVKKKLSRVLWVPIEADASIPLPQRRIGTAILWSPDQEQEKILRQDWEELTGMIHMGELDQITARYGKYLQIRPKAMNARSLQTGIDAEGNISKTLPRGFYLRTVFTRQILGNHHAA